MNLRRFALTASVIIITIGIGSVAGLSPGIAAVSKKSGAGSHDLAPLLDPSDPMSAQQRRGWVNYAFKSGPEPLPVVEVGDVNCDDFVTSADIIEMVNYVFKSGPEPCDVCALP